MTSELQQSEQLSQHRLLIFFKKSKIKKLHRLTSEASNIPPTFGKVADYDDMVDLNMENQEEREDGENDDLI